MSEIDFRAMAEAMREELIARRRDLHQHPELAFEEYRTAGIVADELSALGLEVQKGVGRTGVVAILEGQYEGPTVLLRADMDALPIQEANEVEYKSTAAGKMHACGHDGHTTIALGVAKLLSQHRDRMTGRVKFVFQPAEEIAQGAKEMIRDGVLRDVPPDVTLGLHLWNSMPVGNLGISDGPVMAASSDFRIDIEGRGGHGALPHETIDPVLCAAHIVTAFQSIVSRNVDPMDTAVVTVGQVHAGTAFNVIPQTAMMDGTVRTFRTEVRDMVAKRMREIAEGIAAAMQCRIDFHMEHDTAPVVNDTATTERVLAAMLRVDYKDLSFMPERTMGAEDVGFFMDDIPGTFFFLGCANAERGLDAPHHHPRFDFDEAALPIGVALLSAAVAEFVMGEDRHG